MKNIFWSGYSNEERHAAITTIQHLVLKYGSITDFTAFTDIALTFIIETEASKVNALYDELKTNLSMDSYDHAHTPLKKETTIFLNVTFSKGTGDLRIEAPAVPG